MKFLKYILLFLISFLLSINLSAIGIVVVENQNTFFGVTDNQTNSDGYTWLGGTLHAILQQKGLNIGTVSKKHPNH